ncbi:hypothetical protein NEUTE1DRAFT_98592 [Neurospora tetrasperma FGSC 2508]|uniref:Uncharacterized protein n=1 Tax=Neurospora tetrasperma (strain FGSC 2508 / ATCC MYA-4615 / P0657) TaxID=510951 RepID=F8MDQ1_NEUT8|nr:uncharacterized protein NEUTE1DRAFT_98592 [Neurospora tetrasperma FGSC 2508]EGO61489.1 hypothetical protein NEUTE1DRAFT_98592 [Neurospora tetrasperma FGSC 2508]EGZ74475.1 hypothetical protein NEUTE2DRAFT_55796 [Neurospora tetrasperma FGSC 2509]
MVKVVNQTFMEVSQIARCLRLVKVVECKRGCAMGMTKFFHEALHVLLGVPSSFPRWLGQLLAEHEPCLLGAGEQERRNSAPMHMPLIAGFDSWWRADYVAKHAPCDTTHAVAHFAVGSVRPDHNAAPLHASVGTRDHDPLFSHLDSFHHFAGEKMLSDLIRKSTIQQLHQLGSMHHNPSCSMATSSSLGVSCICPGVTQTARFRCLTIQSTTHLQELQSVRHDGDSGPSCFGYSKGIVAFEQYEIDASSIEVIDIIEGRQDKDDW